MHRKWVFFVVLCLAAGLCFSCSSSKKSSSSSSSDNPPVADFTGSPTSGDAPLTVNFTNASTGTITSYSWDFGDSGTSTTASPQHIYNADGQYTVTLTVVGPGGSDTKIRSNYITVGTIPGPTVDFEGTPLTGGAPLEVAFTDLSTGNNVHAWEWDFNDDSTVDSTVQNPTHTYSAEGTYSVTLTATDDDGTKSATKTDYITVTGAGAGTGIDPSGGSGGTIAPGSYGTWTCTGHDTNTIKVYIPTSYNPGTLASPVIWLCNEQIYDWQTIADNNGIILIDLEEYGTTSGYVSKIQYAYPKLEAEYNVDKARYYFAGWSAGGNVSIMLTDVNQTFIAAAMVFPGSGGAAPSIPAGRPAGAKYYYAVGDQDTSTGYYPGCVDEASYRQGQGYTTKCDVVNGVGHSVPNSKRLDGWNWVKGFNTQN